MTPSPPVVGTLILYTYALSLIFFLFFLVKISIFDRVGGGGFRKINVLVDMKVFVGIGWG